MANLQNTRDGSADPGKIYFGDRIQSVIIKRLQSGESDRRIYHVR